MKTDKDTLNKAIKGFLSRLEKTEKFVLDQAPDLCKEMIREVLVENYMQLGIAILLALISVPLIPIALHNGITYTTSYNSEEPTRYFFLMLLAITGSVASVCVASNAAYYLLYVKYCPKLFLVRQFKKLVK